MPRGSRYIALYALLAALAYVLALVATLPAAVAYAWARPSHTNLRVYDINGTVWHGEAGVKLKSIAFSNVQWHFDPWALFSAHLGYRIEAKSDTSDLHGSIEIDWQNKLNFDALQGTLPVSALQAWLPLPPHSLSATLRVNLAHIAFDNAHPSAIVGTLELDNTRLLWPIELTLGDYLAKLTTDAGEIRGSATDASGPLHLNASGTLSPAGSYTISGTLAPGVNSSNKLKQALHYVGEPDARGRYHVAFNGHL